MKDILYSKAIAWVTKKGFQEIKANIDDFETPLAFTRANEESQVIPDITAKMHGTKSYIEVVTKNEDKQTLITKWKLLSAVASRKGGKVYLLTGRGYKAFADNIIKNHNLTNAKVIAI